MTATVDTRQVQDPGAAPTTHRPARRRWLLGLGFAGLLGLGVAQTTAMLEDDSPILQMNGVHLVAAGRLNQELYGQLAPADRGTLSAGDVYRNVDGVQCRTFANKPDFTGPTEGVACELQGEWRVVELRQDTAPTTPGSRRADVQQAGPGTDELPADAEPKAPLESPPEPQ